MIKKSDRVLVCLFGICLAIGALYLAVPRSVAAYHGMFGDRAAKSLSSGRLPTPGDLEKLAVSRATALQWGENAEYARDLARAYYAMRRTAGRESRKSLAIAVEAASIREIGWRPLNANAWWRLAEMQDARFGRRNRKATAYLWRSVEVQKNASGLMASRLNSIIRHWWQFDPEVRQVLKDQVMATARADWKGLIRVAMNPQNSGVIRAGLVSNPQYLGALEAALYKASRKR